MRRASTGGQARALPRLAALVALAGGSGCLEYSPHAVPDGAEHRDVHPRNVERLLAQPAPPLLRFALVGDTQLRLDPLRDAVDALNGRDDVAFLVHLGDLTHLGLAREYELANDLLARLRMPYFVTIGNHDFLSNGTAIYRAVFGPWNFAFTWADTRFVFVDTNSLEAGFDGSVPDLPWLEAQLAPAADHRRAFIFAHVDPDERGFDERMTPAWEALLRDGGVVASFHGHRHAFRSWEREGVRYVVADDIEGRVYYLVTERPDGGFDVEGVEF
jgi:3',5'-cyclic AMP phosphodiesterase CpdA